MSNILIGLKKTCLGVLDRRDRDKNNETDLKEGGRIEMSTTVLHSRCALLRFEYLRLSSASPRPVTPRQILSIATAAACCNARMASISAFFTAHFIAANLPM